MILNLYRLVICTIMAYHAYAWYCYVAYDIPIPMSIAVWATAFTVLFFFERLYITIRMEYEVSQYNARMGED